MKKERILNGIKIIEKAISENISVKKASVMCGFSDSYLKNTKKDLDNRFEDGKIKKDEYDKFQLKYKEYKDLSEKNGSYKNGLSKKGAQTKFDVNNDNDSATLEWKSPYAPGHIKTLDGLLKKCNVDTGVWKVNDYVVNKWDVTTTKTGIPQTFENFQIKARLSKKYDNEKVLSAIEVFNNLVKKYTPPTFKTTNKSINENNSENNLLEISLFDLHLGKFGWSGEVKDEFNVEIASKRFIEAIKKLLNRAKGYEYNKILFPIGNDFLNVDNRNYTTAGNTPQQDDGTWQQTFSIATKLLVDGINLMRETGVDVDVVVIPGNHDYERSFYLGSFLEAWFKGDENVNIDNGASPRKYYEFGNLLLGLSHGKYEKEASLPMLMATEMKEAWGNTEFHEWHVGHIHRKRSVNYAVLDKQRTTNEDLGVTVRYLSSLTGDETWHNKMGFVGSTKAGEGFIWNDITGLIGQVNTNII